MGQYYYIINRTKRQYLHPHRFDDGLKLMEFGRAGGGTMTALAILLADGNGRGGGDIRSDDALIGSWAGDSIVISGDYSDGGKFVAPADLAEMPDANLHQVASERFEDISAKVLEIMRKAGESRRD